MKNLKTYSGNDERCCYGGGSDCCWDRCTRNPPPIDAFEYIPGGKWIKDESTSAYRAYSGK